MQRWEYRVVPWPADAAATGRLGADDYAETLQGVLASLGDDGYELTHVVARSADAGGEPTQDFLVLRRPGRTGEADYRREDLDYVAGEL